MMDTREKILDTATRLFSSQGYATTSLSQVAKEARVSKALIFWHFENKDALFRTVIQRTLEPFIIDVLDDLEGLDEIDQVKRLVDEYYAFVSKNLYSVKFFLGLILREEKQPDDVTDRMTELQRVFQTLIGNILESGRQKGLLRDGADPVLAAGLIVSALQGLLVQRAMEPDGSTAPPELLAYLKESLVDALRC